MANTNLKITWLGHATVLIEAGDQAFLTDPNFAVKLWGRIPRIQPLPLSPANLPPLSGILISNARYDHLNLPSLKFFDTHVPVLTPQGVSSLVRKFYSNPTTELSDQGQHRIRSVTLHAGRVHEYGFRLSPLCPRPTLSYLLETPFGNVFFAGHSKYGSHFKTARSRLPIDVAILPLGSPRSSQVFSSRCLTPEQALQAMEDLGAKYLIPIRYGTFQFPHEDAQEMKGDLFRRAQELQVQERVVFLRGDGGDSFTLPGA